MKKRWFFVLFFVLLFVPIALGLTLDESIQIAKNKNPLIISAKKKLEASKASLLQATGAFFPTLNLDASTGQMYQQPSEVSFTTTVGTVSVTQKYLMGVDSQIPTRRLNLTLTQPIFTGGRLTSAHNLAQNNYKITYEDLRSKTASVIFDTTTAYFGVIKSEKLVELSEQSYNMAKNHFEQAKALFETGISTRSDILRSEVQLINAEISLTKAKNGLIIAKNNLNNLLGNHYDNEIKVEQSEFENIATILPSYEKILGFAYQYRPEWIQFKLSADIANNNLNIAKSDVFPSVVAIGTYGSSYSQYPTYSTDTNSWTAMLSASWNIIDIKTTAKIKEAYENLEAQNANETFIKNNIALEIKNAYLDLKTAQDTISSAKKALDLAEENYKVASLRYSAQVATNLEVIDAEVALTQARINNLNAQFDIQTAKAKLNKLAGKDIL